MSRNGSVYSFYNAISALLGTLINGLLGMLVVYFVLQKFGSDFNGLNATANQIVQTLLLVEGGFTLASNVALFKPVVECDVVKINSILTYTRARFRKIAWLFIFFSIVVVFFSSKFINSKLDETLITMILTMAVVPQFVSLFFGSSYLVLLQAQQKEYVYSFVTLICTACSNVAIIAVLHTDCEMWMIRFITMAFAVLGTAVLVYYVKKRNRYIDFCVTEHESTIVGTGDVMIQKLTAVLYGAMPMVFLSLMATGGTVLASVYAVYFAIFNMVRSVIYGIINAPRLTLGQMIAVDSKEKIWKVFKQYELVSVVFSCTLLSAVFVVIGPFVGFYTKGVVDVQYRDYLLAILFALTAIVEIIHIPSGHFINVSGEFRVSRNIQIVGTIVLAIGLTYSLFFGGMYTVAMIVLLAAVVIALLEIGYVHQKCFEFKIFDFIQLAAPNIVVMGIVAVIEEKLFSQYVTGYLSFVGIGTFIVLINFIIVIAISYWLCRDEMILLKYRVLQLFRYFVKEN